MVFADSNKHQLAADRCEYKRERLVAHVRTAGPRQTRPYAAEVVARIRQLTHARHAAHIAHLHTGQLTLRIAWR